MVSVFVKYYYNGGASSVKVIDTVRLAKLIDDVYTIDGVKSNVPLTLDLVNVYTIVSNLSTYDTLTVDTSTRDPSITKDITKISV